MMSPIELPNGKTLSPFAIKSYEVHKHFWNEKKYISLQLRAGLTEDIENLTPDILKKWIDRLNIALEEATTSTSVYDDAYQVGHDDGYQVGYREGWSKGLETAESKLWETQDNVHGPSGYNIGYERGHEQGQLDSAPSVREEISRNIEQLVDEVTNDLISQIRTVHSRDDTAQEITVSNFSRLIKKRMLKIL